MLDEGQNCPCYWFTVKIVSVMGLQVLHWLRKLK